MGAGAYPKRGIPAPRRAPVPTYRAIDLGNRLGFAGQASEIFWGGSFRAGGAAWR